MINIRQWKIFTARNLAAKASKIRFLKAKPNPSSHLKIDAGGAQNQESSIALL